jgi:molybdopterin converting factor small subunit
MTLTIEFFGIPRQRTGVVRCELTFAAETITLEQVLAELGRRFPPFANDCSQGGHLAPGYAANLAGERFISDPDTPLHDGDELLILSADAGG